MAAAKRRSLTLDVKREIVVLIESKQKKQADIVREYCISKSTVSDIWSSREKLKTSLQFADNIKKMRKSNYEDVEEALLMWLKQVRSLGASVSGPVLKQKALALAVELGHADFRCSDSWLERFKRRRAVIFQVLAGETPSEHADLSADWLQNKLPLDQHGEAGLFTMLPHPTAAFGGEDRSPDVDVCVVASPVKAEPQACDISADGEEQHSESQMEDVPLNPESHVNTFPIADIYKLHLLKKIERNDKEILLLDRQILKTDLEIQLLQHKLDELKKS